MRNDGEAGRGTLRECDEFLQHNNESETLRCSLRWAQESQSLAVRILTLLNQQITGREAIRNILRMVKEFTGFEAVAIRLREGDDFPYYVTNGFPDDFVEAERYLCDRNDKGQVKRDADGNPVLECMCGNILRGRTDPSYSFFTEGGSFWSCHTTELLATTTDADRQTRTRNRCNAVGYESVALIPLRSDRETIGLLQLNDSSKDRFTLDMITFFEGIGASIGIVLARVKAEEDLRRSREELETEVAERTVELRKAYEQIQLELAERERREEELRRWSSVIEHAQWGIVYSSRDLMSLDFMNPAFAEMHGYTVEDLSGRPILDVFAPEERTTLSHHIAIANERGHYIWESKHIRKDGTIFPVLIDVTAVKDEHGHVLYRAVNVQDITERIKAEDALRESQENYRMIFDNAPLGILHFDQNGVMQDFNEKFVEMIGAPREKLIGFNMPERQKDERMRQAVLGALGGKSSYYEGDYLSVTGGKLTPMRAFYSPVFANDGRLLGAVGIFEDMTERKRAEKALLESEEKYRAVFNIASVGIDLVDRQGKFLEVNSTLAKLLGYTRAELRQLTILDVTHPEDLSRSREMHENLVHGVEGEYRLEKRYLRKDGTILWSDTAVSAIRDSDGKYTATVGVIRDITQRKKSEQARIRLATAVEQAVEGIVITDTRGTIQYVNPAYERITGYSRDEVVGQKPMLLRSKERNSPTQRDIIETLSRGGRWSGHLVKQRKDGASYTAA